MRQASDDRYGTGRSAGEEARDVAGRAVDKKPLAARAAGERGRDNIGAGRDVLLARNGGPGQATGEELGA